MITAFLSYCWKDKLIADAVQNTLESIGITVSRDTNNLQYKDNIHDFMISAENHDLIILIISPDYLRSKNCMFECCNYYKVKKNIKKVLPVVCKNQDFTLDERIKIINYWTNQFTREKENISSLNEISLAGPFLNDLEMTHTIVDNSSELLKLISEELYIIYDATETDWRPLIWYIEITFPEQNADLLQAMLSIQQQKTYDLKLTRLREVTKEYGINDQLLSIEAMVHADNKNYSLSKAILNDLIQRNPENAKYINNLACIFIESNENIKEAEKLLLTALEMEPNNNNVLINLGNYYSEFSLDLVKSEYFYRKSLLIYPKDPYTWAAFGNFLRERNKDPELALELLERAYHALPDEPLIACNYATFLSDYKKDSHAAFIILEHCINIDQSNPILLFNMGNIALDCQSYDVAHQSYLRALQLNPNISDAYLGLGHVYKKYFRNFEIAEKNYLKAIEMNPENSQYYYNYGILLYEMKRYQEAINVFRKAVELDNNDWESWNFIGVSLGFGLNMKAEALLIFDMLIDNPTVRIRSLYNKGILIENELPQDAITCYESIISIQSTDIEALNRLMRLIMKVYAENEVVIYKNKLKIKYGLTDEQVDSASA